MSTDEPDEMADEPNEMADEPKVEFHDRFSRRGPAPLSVITPWFYKPGNQKQIIEYSIKGVTL